jgi:peptide/nickel transport system substrate-binding protein
MTRTSSRRHRRRSGLVIGAAGLGLISLVSACGASGSSAGSSGGAATLTIATATDITDTDSIQVRNSDDDLLMGSTVYESLFVSGQNNQLTPGLAKDAKASNDFKTWTMDLQQGVKFQDGKPFGAADVKANMDAILDPKNASDDAGDFANVAKTVVVSKYVVQFDLKTPDNGFPGLLTDNFFIGDMTLRAKEGAKAFAEHPVGTGPYEYSSRVVGAETTFKRFDGYWRGRPPLAKVIVKVVSDPTVAALDLEHGDINLIDNFISNAALSTLKSDPNLKLIHRPGLTFSLAFLNFEKARKGGYKNALAFREGLQGLFDAPKVVPEVIGAYGRYADQQIPPFEAGSNPNIKPPVYNQKKDVQLLTEGGYPPGSTISIVVNTAPELCDVATVVQSNIQKLGYKVNLLCNGGNLENNALLGYKWDALLTKLNSSPVASVYYQKRWRLDLATPLDDYYTLEDPALQTVLNKMVGEPTVAKTSAEEQQAEEIIENQQHAIVPLFWSDTWFIANKNVHGLVPTPNGWNNILYNSYTKVSVS